MSSVMNETERQKQLYCTPPHIVKALLRREFFPGTIWEPAAGRGHIVQTLLDCGYTDVIASDLNVWGYDPCRSEDFLVSTTMADSLITNPPFDRKREFLSQAKRLARHKCALLLPVDFEYTLDFVRYHESDTDFPWKAIYVFRQPIPWLNVKDPGGKIRFAWYIFDRGYRGAVLREKISFQRNSKNTGKAHGTSCNHPRSSQTAGDRVLLAIDNDASDQYGGSYK